MTRTRRVASGVAALALAGAWALSASACATRPDWFAVLPPGGESWTGLSALAATSEGLCVATAASDRPRVFRVAPGAVSISVPVLPATGYGREASLRWFARSGTSVVAVGGARGGAHANIRWTAWRTDGASRLVEREQPFETFGGWDAGTLVGLVDVAGRPVLVGSWRGAVGLDIALWTPVSDRWQRVPTPTGLASGAGVLRTVAAAGATADAIVLVGNEVVLADGAEQRPVAWTAPAASGPWRRTELPGGPGRATAVACGASACVAAGRDASATLRVWLLTDGVATEVPVGVVPVGDAVVPLVASGKADAIVAVPAGSGTRLFKVAEATSQEEEAPPGSPLALAVASGRLYLATAPDGGPPKLFAADFSVS